MLDPLLGKLTWDDGLDGHVSKKKKVPCLGVSCAFVLQGLDDDPRPEELRAAVKNMLAAGPEVLKAAQPHVVHYCEDILALYAKNPKAGPPPMTLKKPGDVWSHVRFGDTLYVKRRNKGGAEDGVYLTLECNCDWEREHGLQLVFREGKEISRVGPFDGHLTNAAAYAKPALVGVVYKRIGKG
jgi:hypothetical protein